RNERKLMIRIFTYPSAARLLTAITEWQRQERLVIEDYADESQAHLVDGALAPTHWHERVVRVLGIAGRVVKNGRDLDGGSGRNIDRLGGDVEALPIEIRVVDVNDRPRFPSNILHLDFDLPSEVMHVRRDSDHFAGQKRVDEL